MLVDRDTVAASWGRALVWYEYTLAWLVAFTRDKNLSLLGLFGALGVRITKTSLFCVVQHGTVA